MGWASPAALETSPGGLLKILDGGGPIFPENCRDLFFLKDLLKENSIILSIVGKFPKTKIIFLSFLDENKFQIYILDLTAPPWSAGRSQTSTVSKV